MISHCIARPLAAAITLTALVAAPVAHSAILVTTPGFSYSQDFDTLATSGTPSWSNDATLAGWSLFAGASIATIRADAGTSNAGSFYSFGTGTSTDRALGGVGSGGTYFGSPASGAVAGWIAASFTNTSGQALDGFAVGFDGEQWRNGGNTTAQAMVLEYGFGATFAAVSAWTAPGGSFSWTSPVATATAAAVDGNAAGRVAGRGGTIQVPWNAGDTLWLRWAERNDTGNDHGLAIDNFSLDAGAAVVPVPAGVWLLGSAIGVLGWIRRHRRG